MKKLAAKKDKNLRNILASLRWLVVAGLIALLLFAGGSAMGQPVGQRLSAFMQVLGVIASASGGIGAVAALIGFLFGIPKTRQSQNDNDKQRISYEVNTNLEGISDWLTKMLLGVGLVQMNNLFDVARRLSEFVETALPGRTGAGAFAVGASVYMAVLGFLFGYLTTRMFLAPAFLESDRTLTGTVNVLADLHVNAEDGVSSEGAPGDKEIKRLLAIEYDSLDTVPQLRAWAKAQMMAGNYHLAAEALESAYDQVPFDARVAIEYAIANSHSNNYGEADHVLRKSLRHASQDDLPEIYGAMIYNSLYLAPPTGFEQAIQLGDEAKGKAIGLDAGMHFNLACAYGQRHAWHVRKKASPDDARKLTLEHLSQAFESNPRLKKRAAELTTSGDDDDLVSLAEDAELIALLSEAEE